MIEFQAAYILALFAATAFGSADYLGGTSTRRIGLLATALFTQLAGCAGLLVVTAFSPGAPTLSDLLWGAVAGVGDVAGLLLLFRALAIGQMAGVAPTAGVVSSALPVIVGTFVGERPEIVQWSGIALGFAAIAAISWERPTARTSNTRRLLPLILAAAAGCGFSIYYILFEFISAESGVSPVLSARIASAVVVIAWIVPQRRRFTMPRRPAMLGPAIAVGLLASLGNLLFVLAVRQGDLGLVSVLSSLYPAVTAILAIAFLRERPSGLQIAGIGFAVAAVGMIAAG